MKQLVLDLAPPPAPTLENFVPGRNAELVAALYALANGAGDERFIYVWGAEGSGRSHLLRAVIDAARRNGRHTAWLGAGTEMLVTGGDVICGADDVHLLGDDAQVALFNLYNRIRGGTGGLVASGNSPPAQLKLRADLGTRLAAGLVYQLHALDDEEKSVALRRHAETRGLRLPEEVIGYLLRHARRDLPSLIALVDALDRYSLATRRAVTVPLLREVLTAPQPLDDTLER